MDFNNLSSLLAEKTPEEIAALFSDTLNTAIKEKAAKDAAEKVAKETEEAKFAEFLFIQKSTEEWLTKYYPKAFANMPSLTDEDYKETYNLVNSLLENTNITFELKNNKKCKCGKKSDPFELFFSLNNIL